MLVRISLNVDSDNPYPNAVIQHTDRPLTPAELREVVCWCTTRGAKHVVASLTAPVHYESYILCETCGEVRRASYLHPCKLCAWATFERPATTSEAEHLSQVLERQALIMMDASQKLRAMAEALPHDEPLELAILSVVPGLGETYVIQEE